MNGARPDDGVRQFHLSGGVELFVHPTERFRTSLVNILVHRPLDGSTAAAALLPYLLRRGTRSFPTLTAISRRLESLFGAALDVDVFRIGERQILSFRLDFVDDRYLLFGGRDLRAKALDLLREVLLDPLLEKGLFPPDVYEQERTNLERFVAGAENDRARYAFERCVKAMCEGEAYATFEFGSPEEIAALAPEDVVAVWHEILESAPMEVYFVGRADPDRLREEVELRFGGIRDEGGIREIPAASFNQPAEIRRVREVADLVQSRLVMGFRTGIGPADRRCCDLTVFNTLFGGGAFSRLFRQVRERHSLAYYCSSSLDQAKGVAFVQAGIDGERSEEVEQIVLEELDSFRRGEMELDELRAAKAQLLSGLRATADSPARIAGFLQERRLGSWVGSFDEAAKRISRVRRMDIRKVAKSLTLDTVYLLTNNASGHGSRPA